MGQGEAPGSPNRIGSGDAFRTIGASPQTSFCWEQLRSTSCCNEVGGIAASRASARSCEFMDSISRSSSSSSESWTYPLRRHWDIGTGHVVDSGGARSCAPGRWRVDSEIDASRRSRAAKL